MDSCHGLRYAGTLGIISFFLASKKNGGRRVNSPFKFIYNTCLEVVHNAYAYFSMGEKFFSWSFISKHKERLRM